MVVYGRYIKGMSNYINFKFIIFWYNLYKIYYSWYQYQYKMNVVIKFIFTSTFTIHIIQYLGQFTTFEILLLFIEY